MTGRIRFAPEGAIYYLDGKEVPAEEFRKAFPPQDQTGLEHSRTGHWPILSDAVGVHPDQIDEARQNATEKGVPTDFTPDGRAILTSRSHRKAYLRAYGFHDRDGGYGD